MGDFLWFRGEFFTTEDGDPYVTAAFQLRWLRSLLLAAILKSSALILSPPRHGKTDLLTHLVLWAICRFPNIRIIWIGPTEDLAADIVGASVLEHLESNGPMVAAFGGEGFKPARGKKWTRGMFTVATRTVSGIKSPTWTAIGWTGTTLSRDADLIVCDDIEQDKTVEQPHMREKSRRRAITSLFSRRTKRVATWFIGSRQHFDDLWRYFLENPKFDCIVERAHDLACKVDPDDYAAHVDCMLFPEVNPYSWLMEMRDDARSLGGEHLYEMVYLNMAHPSGITAFSAEVIDQCLDRGRMIGELPKVDAGSGGIHLVAGLDPSGVGYQAAVLWAFQVQPELRMWLVDLDNRSGGGIEVAEQLICEEWAVKYPGLRAWIVEENLYHGAIVKRLEPWAIRHGVLVEDYQTRQQKTDPRVGIPGMQPLFAQRQIELPYGSVDTMVKVDEFRKQFIYWDPNYQTRHHKKGTKSDLVMAAWFPMEYIRSMQHQMTADMGIQYAQSYSSFRGSQWSTAPWGRTA